jgi:hypothetical protein
MNKTSFGHAVGIRRRVSFLSERNAARLSSGAVTQDSQGFCNNRRIEGIPVRGFEPRFDG